MDSKTKKSAAILFAALFVISIFSSCNRGGAGCPYELNLPTVELPSIIK